jgi:hypothetical protein
VRFRPQPLRSMMPSGVKSDLKVDLSVRCESGPPGSSLD